MYIVIRDFRDMHDKDHQYHEGDVFPREGIKVSDERIAELATDSNRLKTPLIAEVIEEEPVEEPVEEPAEEPEEAPKPRRRRRKKEE